MGADRHQQGPRTGERSSGPRAVGLECLTQLHIALPARGAAARDRRGGSRASAEATRGRSRRNRWQELTGTGWLATRKGTSCRLGGDPGVKRYRRPWSRVRLGLRVGAAGLLHLKGLGGVPAALWEGGARAGRTLRDHRL